MPNTAVAARSLRKRYRNVAAVDGIDLDVQYGEVYALLGPNGAGKTTTVEILEGYRRRDQGQVQVLGTDPQHAPLSWRHQIGIVLQHARDVAELTVAETMRHFAGYYPHPRDPDQVIDDVGLRSHARRRLRALSVGQRRRVDVAIGIVGRPRLLFLDEPTTGFDPQARRQFWTLIRTLARAGDTTILLTTHYLDEVEALADRVGIIHAGRVVATGTPTTLGGRANRPATVGWLDSTTRRTLTTTDPATAVAGLARRFGGTVPGLTVTRPTLEDIYLELIGAPPG